MRLLSRRVIVGVTAAAAAVPMFGAPAAHADRCEPTEPAVRLLYPGYEEPVAEADNPFCYAMLNYVYPRLCTDSSTLLPNPNSPGCIRTISPDLNEPVVVYGYSPNGTRITCNVANFALYVAGQSPAC